MSDSISRRAFTALTAGLTFGSMAELASAQDTPKLQSPPSGPIEAPLQRDYPAPDFKPGWKKPQLNRVMVQDFVIYAHFDLEMVKKLLDKEPMLLNGMMDWGNGDWETGLGGASHMGRRDIVEYLLEKGARPDLFCAAMLGQIEVVRTLLTFQPKLIDSRGPHGFSLHFHAQVGGKPSEPVLDYLQSIKKIELKPNPFLKPADPSTKKP